MAIFKIQGLSSITTFYKENSVLPGVHRIAEKVCKDIERVIDYYPEEILDKNSMSEYPVIYGTIGRSAILDELEQLGKIDLSDVRGKWEVYGFWLVENPFPCIKCALVIAGSDKRGTIYGLFHISELIGVSPLIDWSDVRPEKKSQVVFTDEVNMISKVPSVKYRGFFINDEWPSFGTWANHHFGGFNSTMYEHVFELLLRLKGNYLWPAMWSSCFSCDGPGLANAELADEYGVVMGTSHHEPCIRHGEEYRYVRGENSIYGDAWDFITNREGIIRFWKDGLKRNGKFENIITLGMRGECDTAILSEESTLEDNITLLKEVIKTQNQLIQEIICSDLLQVPRLFVLFTEVEAFFYGDSKTKGLMNDLLLDGVTLMLCDDNYGNIRSLPTQEMRRHRGGYGLYYHLDFHGGPYAYDWMNTNYLPKMWEQLTTAYDYGIQEVWVANVGDISLLEYPLSYFMDMAYDMESMGSSMPNQIEAYTRQWINKQFNGAFSKGDMEFIKIILDGYSRINHNRKPELMNVDVYHPVHYSEAKDLIALAEYLSSLAEELRKRCPEQSLPSFYELVYYPAIASMNILKMWLFATINEYYAKQGRVEANDYADEVAYCIDYDHRLTSEYNRIGAGKWYGMGMSEHIGFVHWCEEDCKYPRMVRIAPVSKPRLIVAASNSIEYTIGTRWSGDQIVVTDFLEQHVQEVDIELACGSIEPISYKVTSDCPWLMLSTSGGTVVLKDILTLKINRKLFKGRATGEVWIKTDFSNAKIIVEAQNTDITGLNPMTFLEANGYIAIEAEHYCKKEDVKGAGFYKLDQYGRTLSGMKVLPPIRSDFTRSKTRPYLEYSFIPESEGMYHIDIYLAPSNPAYINYGIYIGIQMNNGTQAVECVLSPDYASLCSCKEYVEGVKNNIRIHHSMVECVKGINYLRLYAVSPSVVIEKIVLFSENSSIQESYLGPKESYYVQ